MGSLTYRVVSKSPLATHQSKGSPPQGETGLPDRMVRSMFGKRRGAYRDTSKKTQGCMQQEGHVEVCHSRASVGPATVSYTKWIGTEPGCWIGLPDNYVDNGIFHEIFPLI